MSYDLGHPVPLAITISVAGVPTDSTLVLTITLPDGVTVVTPAVSHDGTGQYSSTYVTTVAGRHAYTWTASGVVVDSWGPNVFDVRSATGGPLVSLDDVKNHLSIPLADTSNDEKLRDFIAAATRVVEHYVGACNARTVVDTFTGDWLKPIIFPRSQPIISLTSVTELGITLTQGVDYLLTQEGGICRIAGTVNSYPRGWVYGVNDVVVTYIAGRSIIPDNIIEATKALVAVNWRPERGGNMNPYDENAGDPFAVAPVNIQEGIYVPPSVIERLTPHLDMARGIA